MFATGMCVTPCCDHQTIVLDIAQCLQLGRPAVAAAGHLHRQKRAIRGRAAGPAAGQGQLRQGVPSHVEQHPCRRQGTTLSNRCYCAVQLVLQPSSPCTVGRLTPATRRSHQARGNTHALGPQVIETPCDKGDNDEPVPLFEADKGAGLSHPNIVQTYKSSSTISKVLPGF